MKKLCCYLLALLLVLGCFGGLAGCKDNKDKDGGGKVTGGVKGYPEVEMASDKVVVCSNAETRDRYKELLKDVYGLEVEDIVVHYNDYTTRYATLVLSGDSPDVGFYRSDQADFPRYIVNDLVDDVKQYVDLSDSFYDPVRDLLDATNYQGGQYMMPYGIGTSQTIFYNEKLFRDAGLETPWELYLKDEWTLDKLQEYAIELTEIGDDGVPTRYGFTFNRPFGISYCTGKAFGSFDSETGAVINNVDDPAFARVMNYVSKWVSEYKCTSPRIEETLAWLKIDKAAMVFSQGFYTDNAVLQLAKDGNLGMCPMARDPEADGYYARGACSSWWLTKGAKNPGGAIAFWNIHIQDRVDGGYLEETYQTCEENGFSELNMEQLRTNCDQTKVKPVLELTPWIGSTVTWMTIQDSSTWEVELEKRSATIQAMINELFQPLEEDLPLSPKPVDTFEGYGDDTETHLVNYVVSTNGGQNIKLTLDTENAQGGSKYALKYAYDVTDKGWGGVSLAYNKTWENNNALRMWVKGDGTEQNLRVKVICVNGGEFVYEFDVSGSEGKIVSAPFSDFEVSDSSFVEEWSLSKITRVELYVQTEGKHTIWIDNIEAYNTDK